MSNTGVAVLVASATELYDLLGPKSTQWAIYAAGTSTPIISPDSFASIDMNADSRICDYPVEQGAFETYNKVMVPQVFRIQLVCAGKAMFQGDFLEQLEIMRQTTMLVDVATPEILYENRTLTRYDQKRTAQNGVSMLTVECVFEQVRQAGKPTYSTAGDSGIMSNSPSAATPVNNGTVHPGDSITVTLGKVPFQ